MKRILGIVVLSLLLSCNAHAASKWGKGELTLSDGVTNGFIKFIKGNSTRSPHLFAVSIDGRTMIYYYCASGPNNCRGGDTHIIEECERRSDGVECALFSRNRTIKWKNEINPGKGKVSTIKSKWSDAEIRAKLTELGFLGGSTSSSTTNKKIKEGVVSFNKCSWSLNEEDYYWSFEVDLNKGSYLKEVFFAKGEIYNDKFKIILNNDDFIKTKIKNIYDDKYVQYEFNKKKDEITKFTYNDKKGKDKDDTMVLICNDIVGTLNSLETKSKKKKKEPKKVKKSTDTNKGDIIGQIKDLKELLDAGVLTQDEFDKAKKKILN